MAFFTQNLGFYWVSTVMQLMFEGDVMFMHQLLAFIEGMASIYHDIVHCKVLKLYCDGAVLIQLHTVLFWWKH